MKAFSQMNNNELCELKKELEKRYLDFKARDLKLDMSRGKPASEQLDLSLGLLKQEDYMIDGIDCRNYGGLEGLPAMRRFFGELLDVNEKNVIVGGTSSLTLMYDYLSQAMLFGVMGNTPWSKLYCWYHFHIYHTPVLHQLLPYCVSQ